MLSKHFQSTKRSMEDLGAALQRFPDAEAPPEALTEPFEHEQACFQDLRAALEKTSPGALGKEYEPELRALLEENEAMLFQVREQMARFLRSLQELNTARQSVRACRVQRSAEARFVDKTA